ncbi:MAG: 3-isopropylmalate dehydrogenase [Candidatus Kaiserbacteria bacterium GW2011_GWA2_58_9]|uniref:3-isopropylmalate dehydrogenase n=1 Tax=Candidatus Kaiserbacteria bacterium GW2011_GWA2_58_9 TaxID=1618672 RepID=A0A0G2B1Z9_9BACT|nr:MAG: 3-isopropylmalate dehydrogenase [Candidatus Kaiserbacteria bacterium GW2011_GWA2_58_9]
MKGKIAVVPGDGIGPEICRSAVDVLDAVNKRFVHEITTFEGKAGGEAFEKSGKHLPEETIDICEKADAILFGAVGGPVDAQEKPKWKDAEKHVILGLRKKFDLFANLRPLRVWPGTESFSALKPELVKDMDVLIVRELVSGIYFGRHERVDTQTAEDVSRYSKDEIERVLRVAFDAAASRRKKLTVVDKANVLETSRLWREVANAVKKDFPAVEMEFMFVDNAAMQLVRNPAQFDVIVTDTARRQILRAKASQIRPRRYSRSRSSCDTPTISTRKPTPLRPRYLPLGMRERRRKISAERFQRTNSLLVS